MKYGNYFAVYFVLRNQRQLIDYCYYDDVDIAFDWLLSKYRDLKNQWDGGYISKSYDMERVITINEYGTVFREEVNKK